MIDTEVLRKKIIELGIQGKLTEQLPSDGDAESLYVKIREEKAKLVKEGKIKKNKELPDIAAEEILFEIPNNWRLVHYQEIYYQIGNKNNQITSSELLPTGSFPAISQGKIFIDGFSNDKSKAIYDIPVVLFGDHTRNVKYIDEPFVICADGTQLMKPICINSKFFYYVTYYLSTQIQSRGYARHYSMLKKNIVAMPPLAEQIRIVDKLEGIISQIDILDDLQKKYSSDLAVLKSKIIDAGIQGKLTEQLPEDGDAETLYDQIQKEKVKLVKEGKIKKEKPLADIAEDEIPFEIPNNWKWVRLSEVIDVRDGTHDTPGYISEGYPLITGKDFYNGYFDFTKTKYISKEDYEEIIKRSKVDIDDILFSMIGGNIGSMIVITKDNYIDMAIKNVALFKQYNYDVSLSGYLEIFLRSQVSKMQAIAIGGAQSFVSLTMLRNYLFPLPPIEEQKRMVSRINEILPICERLVQCEQ